MARETKKISVDIDVDTLKTLDELKTEGDFKSRSKLLNFILPTALGRLDDAIIATEAQITADNLQEGETEYEPQYTPQVQRLVEYHETDKREYAGFTQGDDVTLFYRNPQEGFIARIWLTSKGYRFVILFGENAFAVLSVQQLRRAIDAAKEAKRVQAHNEARRAA